MLARALVALLAAACASSAAAQGATCFYVLTAYNSAGIESRYTNEASKSFPGAPTSAQLSWVAPTHNEDGSVLTDLAGYRVRYGCTASGRYEHVTTLDDPAALSYTVEHGGEPEPPLIRPRAPGQLSVTWAPHAPHEPMSFSQVATATSTSSANGGSTTPAIDSTGANLLIVVGEWASFSTANATLTDSYGNEWIPLTKKDTGNSATRIFYCAGSPTVGTGHTFTLSGTNTFAALTVYAYSGAAASPFDSENGATGGTPLNTGNVTPSADGALIIAGVGASAAVGAFSASNGFTYTGFITLTESHGAAYLEQTTAATVSTTWTGASGSATAGAVIAVFLPDAGGGGVTGTGDLEAQAATVDGTGERTVAGTGALAAQAATLSATGERTITGSGAAGAQAAQVAGTGERTITGTGAAAAQAAALAGTGERVVTGSGAPAAQAADVDGSGTVGGVITGTGALEAQPADVDGTGERSVVGTGTPTAQSSAAAGTGERVVTGAGTPASQAAAVAGAGQVGSVITGTGDLEAQAAAASGTGERTVKGTGSLAPGAAVVAGTAERSITGAAILLSGAAAIAGTGERVITAAGALAAQAANVLGFGAGIVLGSGNLVAQSATVVGVGTLTPAVLLELVADRIFLEDVLTVDSIHLENLLDTD